eukprot:EG_transcript_7936
MVEVSALEGATVVVGPAGPAAPASPPHSPSAPSTAESQKRRPSCPTLEDTPSPTSKRRRLLPSRYVAGATEPAPPRPPPSPTPSKVTAAETEAAAEGPEVEVGAEVRYQRARGPAGPNPDRRAVVVWFEDGDPRREVFAGEAAQLEAASLMQRLEEQRHSAALLLDGALARLYAYSPLWEARLCDRLAAERQVRDSPAAEPSPSHPTAPWADVGEWAASLDPVDGSAALEELNPQCSPAPPATPPQDPTEGEGQDAEEAEEATYRRAGGHRGSNAAVLWFGNDGEESRTFESPRAAAAALRLVQRLEEQCFTCAAVVDGQVIQWYAYNASWERRLCKSLLACQLVSGWTPVLDFLIAGAPSVPAFPHLTQLEPRPTPSRALDFETAAVSSLVTSLTKTLLKKLESRPPTRTLSDQFGLSYFVSFEGDFVLEFFRGSGGLAQANKRFDEASACAMAAGRAGHIVRLYAPDRDLERRLHAFLKDNELDR